LPNEILSLVILGYFYIGGNRFICEVTYPMTVADVEIKDKDPELNDFIDNVQQILNNGKYQFNVVDSVPTYVGDQGETTIVAGNPSSPNTQQLYTYANGQWNYISFGQSGAVQLDGSIAMGNFFGANSVDGMWLGAPTWNTAPFRVDMNGNLYADSATITGQITATSGDIGGWVINQFGLTGSAGEVGLLPGSYPFYAGNTNPALAPFSVTFAGVLTASSGTIGGWYISPTSLASAVTVNTANVLLDPVNSLMRLGPTTGPYITVSGANKSISTSDFVSGPLGSGWSINSNWAWFNNIYARGALMSSSFITQTISSVGGSFLVCNSDVLSANIGS
jgi:hypothetical protein